jgi:GMP reductase
MVSNMDTTGTIEMAIELQKYKVLTCLHKFYKASDLKNDLLDSNYYAVSTGINEKDLENLCIALLFMCLILTVTVLILNNF